MNKLNSAYKSIGEVAKILELNDEKKGRLKTHTIDFGKKNLNKLNQNYLIQIEDIMIKIQ